MKPSVASDFYDYLQDMVVDGTIDNTMMEQALQVIIELNKVADLPPPAYFGMVDGRFVFRWNSGHTLLGGGSLLEFDFEPHTAFRYMTIYDKIVVPWSIGQKIPHTIADKLKLFAEK